MAGPLGVARGDRALAVRRVRTDDDSTRNRMWKLEGVPAIHSYADVHAMLAERCLQDLEFIANRIPHCTQSVDSQSQDHTLLDIFRDWTASVRGRCAHGWLQ